MKIWTLTERRDLIAVYATTSDDALATRFGCTAAEVAAEAARLALGRDKRVFPGRPMPRWTDEEVARLRELYPHHGTLQVARMLGRSYDAVESRAARMGLLKTQLRRTLVGRWAHKRSLGA